MDFMDGVKVFPADRLKDSSERQRIETVQSDEEPDSGSEEGVTVEMSPEK